VFINACKFHIKKKLTNIYVTETGKNLVTEQDGLKVILALLKKGISLGNVEGASFLRNVAAGVLLNFLVDQEMLYRKVNFLKTYLYIVIDNGDIVKIESNSKQ